MRFNLVQLSTIGAAVLLMILLLSLGRTTPFTKKGASDTNGEDSITFNDEMMMAGARSKLDTAQLNLLTKLEQQVAQAAKVEEELLSLKLISRTWNEFGNFAAGGYFAQKVAELQPNAEAWNLCGTTYGIAFNREKGDAGLKKYVGHKSVEAFQKAIELAPDSINYRINEALMYVDLSMVDAKVMPMIGAQKMLALDKEYPNNVKVNLHLGRLSLNRTGDIKKAIPRFERILAIADTSTVDQDILLEVRISLTECFKKQQLKEKVLFHYDQAIRVAADNNNLVADIERARSLFESGN